MADRGPSRPSFSLLRGLAGDAGCQTGGAGGVALAGVVSSLLEGSCVCVRQRLRISRLRRVSGSNHVCRSSKQRARRMGTVRVECSFTRRGVISAALLLAPFYPTVALRGPRTTSQRDQQFEAVWYPLQIPHRRTFTTSGEK